jgi:co-chaperonin GroES (HSP10)
VTTFDVTIHRRGASSSPDTAKEKPQQAEVIAAGSGRVNDDGIANSATIGFHRAAGDQVFGESDCGRRTLSNSEVAAASSSP